MCLCQCMACCCSPTSSSSSAFSKADVSFITGVWQRWAKWTSVCHPLMGLGSLQGVHNTSERVAFSLCLPQRRKRPITLPYTFSHCSISLHVRVSAVNWIRHLWTNSTSSWLDGNWPNLARISHSAGFDPAPAVNCNIQFGSKAI